MVQKADVLSWTGMAFGAAGVLAPRLLRKTYGAEANADAEAVLRMWGVRLFQTGALGSLCATQSDLRRQGLQVLLAANAVETVAVLAAGATGALPVRSAVQIAVTDLVVAGVAVLALDD